MAYYLQMDGVDDRFSTPSLAFNKIVIDFSADVGAVFAYVLDTRPTGSAYFANNRNNQTEFSGFLSLLIDGVAQTSLNSIFPKNKRMIA